MIEQTETVERSCCAVPNVILPYNKHMFYSEFQFRLEHVTVLQRAALVFKLHIFPLFPPRQVRGKIICIIF
jgi:hypothetical protein